MKIIAIEEHFILPGIRAAGHRLAPFLRDKSIERLSSPQVEQWLEDLAEERIRRMDESGVDVQVLSLTAPGVQNLEPSEAVSLAQAANDLTAAAVERHPARFEGFCALPTADPAASVRELRRSVASLGLKGVMLFGRTRERSLDDFRFLPILEAAADLGVPLYLHPQTPQEIIRKTYYSGFSEELDAAFATSGWGWHMEAGIQAVRLILSGVFDRLPQLQVILGHWGEMVVFWLERLDALSLTAKHLKRPVADYVRSNFYVTPGGILSQPYLARAVDVIGPERLLFATDYPYQFAARGGARVFVMDSRLDSDAKAAFAHGNWERLTRRRSDAAAAGSGHDGSLPFSAPSP